MAQPVNFVDTSILCNILPIPGRDADRGTAIEQMLTKQRNAEVLILPVTAVIEAGNFIAQLPKGQQRRTTAHRFSSMLELVVRNQAPWRLHQFTWGSEFLRELITGAGTGMTLVEHAVGALGTGDLCILAERKLYAERAKLSDVGIWTLDAGLAGRC